MKKERTSAYIAIKRSINGIAKAGQRVKTRTIATVPITPTSIVKHTLMGDHYARLDFALSEAISFEVGDYFEDPLFGEFVITQKPMPTIDSATGGYGYQVQFDAWYKVWSNKKNMLVISTDDGYIRKECNWVLTDSIAHHVEALLRNLQCLGYINAYADLSDYYDILSSVPYSTKAQTISYNSKDILSSLDEIANTWSTEWWMEENATDRTFKIFFGKCSAEGEELFITDRPYTDSDGVSHSITAESMSIQRDETTYANKFYVYGSKDNIPYSYRKKLLAHIVKNKDGEAYADNDKEFYLNHRFTPDMFTQESSGITFDLAVRAYNESTDTYDKESIKPATIPTGTYNIYGDDIEPNKKLIFEFTQNTVLQDGEECDLNVWVALYLCNSEGNNKQLYFETDSWSWNQWGKDERHEITMPSMALDDWSDGVNILGGDCWVEIRYGWEIDGDTGIRVIQQPQYSSTNMYYTFIATAKPDINEIPVMLNGQLCNAIFNPYDVSKLHEQYYQVRFKDISNNVLTYADLRDNYGIVCDGADLIDFGDSRTSINVPYAFYSEDFDDPSAICRIAERRLQMPELPMIVTNDDGTTYVCRDGFVMKAQATQYKQTVDGSIAKSSAIVEDSIIFENIYPDGKLKITEIYEEECTEQQDIVEADGSSANVPWRWVKYHLTLAQTDGQPFNFDRSYILEGYELAVRFLSPDDTDDYDGKDIVNGFKMCGMQFSVAFNKKHLTDEDYVYKESTDENIAVDAQHKLEMVYTIVRNEDFGTKLPNTVLKPTIGDTVCLINWNTKAITVDGGVISQAEEKLRSKAIEYIRAVDEGNFNFEVHLMSDVPFKLAGDSPLYDADNKPLYDADEKRLYSKNEYEWYKLPCIGQAVNIHHEALGKDKKTRVLGYEYKLDKPYDSPILSCGETDAYSRLKQLEKEVTRNS